MFLDLPYLSWNFVRVNVWAEESSASSRTVRDKTGQASEAQIKEYDQIENLKRTLMF